MRTHARRLLVPTLITLALAASGCSATLAGTTAPTPGAVSTATPAAAAQGSERLDVTPAPQGTPTAVARPAAKGGAGTRQSTFKVVAYDRRTGHAVIATPPESSRDSSPTPTPTPSPTSGRSAEPRAEAPVKTGDVIAGAPAPGAPEGVLVEVTKVVRTSDKATEVATKPATLSALLADDKADGRIPVDPATVHVEPLVKGVKFSWAKPGGVRFGPNGAKVPVGQLRLDVGTALATAADAPVSAAASVSGFVQLAPEVEFSYDGSAHGQAGRSGPGSAFLGMSGDWSAQWALKGRAAAQTSQRIPFAKLHADPVIQVGPVPVVVNLDLTVYLQVEADGRVTLDVRQDVKGDFRVGGGYTPGKGWTPVSTSDVKSTPVTATVTAAGRAKAALGAEASVGLYGMAGLTADFAPYLRAEGEVRASASTPADGSPDGSVDLTGAWALHGGFDLSGNLQLQLSVFGTPVFHKRIPLGSLHREWPLASGRVKRST
ncbi:hypothetical protein [Streptomyces purpureus]|uniref:Lipoprotein n=1 Tax=Streptomyces purpureus TaxID=1951 RepID=A0A918LM74_9ACTN|nr:hypothetical protein [Streptomyces purpureus]GGT16587.1 hypothetical protein GCM10014713_06850 [Streptomyces purpureus]